MAHCELNFLFFCPFSLKLLQLRARRRHHWVRHVNDYQVTVLQMLDLLCKREIQILLCFLHVRAHCALEFRLFGLWSLISSKRLGLEP